jgi:hypothetical protein
VSSVDTWTTRDLLVLEAIARREAEGDAPLNLEQVAAASGLDLQPVQLALRALADGAYLEYADWSDYGGFDAAMIRLREKGRRATGQWPSADPFEGLIALIETRLLDDTLDEPTKSKLRTFRAGLVDVGKGTATGLLTAYIRQAAGI